MPGSVTLPHDHLQMYMVVNGGTHLLQTNPNYRYSSMKSPLKHFSLSPPPSPLHASQVEVFFLESERTGPPFGGRPHLAARVLPGGRMRRALAGRAVTCTDVEANSGVYALSAEGAVDAVAAVGGQQESCCIAAHASASAPHARAGAAPLGGGKKMQ